LLFSRTGIKKKAGREDRFIGEAADIYVNEEGG
jgi:hypothetical protein